eukprot:scaffold5991_cov102-Isochrysis_galbana.AAC.5
MDERYGFNRGHARPPKPRPERWWYLSQEGSGRVLDRFRHIGDTIVPGAGAPRWSHVHAASASAAAAEAAAARAARSWFGLGGAASCALARAEEDDEDELPWQ